MELPDNWFLFKEIVIDKIRTYCRANIWPFQFEDFAAWLHNFDDEKEEYFALQLLDSLIVRSNDMAKVTYARLLHSDVRQYLIGESIISNISIPKWKQNLKQGGLSSVLRFAPVRTLTDEGESGSVIFRLLSSEVETNRYSYAKATVNPKVLILIDDFVGSGLQFADDFAPEFNLIEKLKDTLILYCPLIAFQDGIDFISQKFPKLKILPGEAIDRNESFFYGDESLPFKNDQINSIGEVKSFYAEMQKKYAPKMESWFGYELACLPLVFEWGCPNQTPSILWMNHSKYNKNWHKLFSRRA